jgi:L-seryl-tRNA(Ser) seleniumtransferase
VDRRRDSTGPALRELPAVHELAALLDAPHAVAVQIARRAIAEHRDAVLTGERPAQDVAQRAAELLQERRQVSLRPLINATGVIVHTNLGRAPLPEAAREAVQHVASGYSNLELDLATGRRGSRHGHVEGLLRELTGAEAATVVTNGAAAVLVAAAALAGRGGTIVISRGQLVEIGGGFRIPEVIGQSGATLREVGTTNRTRLPDYEAALAGLDPDRAVVMRVHQSNFRSLGFVEDVAIEPLCGLGVPVIDDLGSGVLASSDLLTALHDEPSVRDSVRAGAALVCCSGDKLLGGPQAGLIMGTREAVTAVRTHPLARATRIDKLSLAALEATLKLYLDPDEARVQVPVLAMLGASEAELAEKAVRLQAAIGAPSEIIRATGKVGGGALPLLELEGPAVALGSSDGGRAEVLARALRAADPPVIARISDGRVLLDPRTIADRELSLVAAAARAALSTPSRL